MLARSDDEIKRRSSNSVTIPSEISSLISEERGSSFVEPKIEGNFLVRYWKKTKFGTWDGVYLSCLLSMFGVIMFLRIGYIVGQAGIWQSWIIEITSVIVVFITALSMSALSTNGEIKGGGAYYLISRSLGPEIGGSVGILFTLGTSIAVGLNILGFAEPMITQIGKTFFGSVKNDMRVYGVILLVVLLVFALIGVGWMIKIQFLIALVLFVAIICMIVGCIVKRDAFYLIVGTRGSVFKQNFGSQYTSGENFLTVFGVFFPSMTGIMAGANISGDLKNPSKSLPLGTTTSIITAGLTYLLMTTILASSVLRGVDICGMENPDRGLCFNMIIQVVSIPGGMIYAGIYSASISSALSAIVGSPRILTVVGSDNYFKFMRVFGIRRSNGEPLYSYIPVTIVAGICVAIADLNIIAGVVTIIYLMTYSFINFACFQSSFSKSPGWRPTFKMYNQWVALVGALICFTLTFVLDWRIAIPTALIAFLIYLLIHLKKPNVDWGSSSQSYTTRNIVKQLFEQRRQKEHIKNFRPNFVMFSKNLTDDIKLVQLIQTFKFSYGANFLGLVTKQPVDEKAKSDFYEAESFEKKTKVVFFLKQFAYDDYYAGCQVLLQTMGLGLIKPNTVVLKYDVDLRKDKDEENKFFALLSRISTENLSMMLVSNSHLLSFLNSDPFGTVDVWWLHDDGGLAVLLPHILSRSIYWRKNTGGTENTVPLRLLAISKQCQSDTKNLKKLLKRFRLADFEIKCVYPENDDAMHEDNKWMVIAELVKEHSKKAKLVFITLPKQDMELGQDDYFNLLDRLSEDMPTMMMVKGSGKSVLTSSQE